MLILKKYFIPLRESFFRD